MDRPAFLQGVEKTGEASSKQHGHEEDGSAVERKAEHIYEKKVGIGRELRQAGDEPEKQDGKDDA